MQHQANDSDYCKLPYSTQNHNLFCFGFDICASKRIVFYLAEIIAIFYHLLI